jgi:DMSO/TMAO reductase YedYZ molybdopterin-dependent catalytic subunit
MKTKTRPCAPVRATLFVLALAVYGLGAFAKAPPVPAAAPTVTVGGAVATPLHLDVAALARMPQQRIEASAHDVSGIWEGVALVDLLRAAGVPLGEKLRGRNLLLYVRIGAADGYHVVYALAELDPGFRDAKAILADRHNGKPLDAKEGPFRIIAAGEKRPARWVRQVTSIDVLRAPSE